MWRNDEQRARACEILAGSRGYWRDGEMTKLGERAAADKLGMSTYERVCFCFALAWWNVDAYRPWLMNLSEARIAHDRVMGRRLLDALEDMVSPTEAGGRAWDRERMEVVRGDVMRACSHVDFASLDGLDASNSERLGSFIVAWGAGTVDEWIERYGYAGERPAVPLRTSTGMAAEELLREVASQPCACLPADDGEHPAPFAPADVFGAALGCLPCRAARLVGTAPA